MFTRAQLHRHLALGLDHSPLSTPRSISPAAFMVWVCWAAPGQDPGTGRQLGVPDLSTTEDRSSLTQLAISPLSEEGPP